MLWILSIARRPLDREEAFINASSMKARSASPVEPRYLSVFNRICIFRVQPFVTVI
jgi:hypothetical protein